MHLRTYLWRWVIKRNGDWVIGVLLGVLGHCLGVLLLDLLQDGGGQDYLAVRHWVVTQIVAQGSWVQTRVEHDLGNVNGTCCKHKDLGFDGDRRCLCEVLDDSFRDMGFVLS